MKAFNRLILWTVLTGLALITILNGYVSCRDSAKPGKAYRVEINRIIEQVQRGVPPEEIIFTPGDYTYVNGLSWIDQGRKHRLLSGFLPE